MDEMKLKIVQADKHGVLHFGPEDEGKEILHIGQCALVVSYGQTLTVDSQHYLEDPTVMPSAKVQKLLQQWHKNRRLRT